MDEKRRMVPITAPIFYQGKSSTSTLNDLVAPPFVYKQTTQTRGHAWRSAKQASTDVGGNFSTARIKSFWTSDTSHYDSGQWFGYRYIGPEYAVSPATAVSDALAAVSFSSEASLLTKGTTAIARSLPTNPVADAGTFIGELKSGLPKLVGKELFKTKFKDYRKVGSEYLNVEFGWKPLVSDLQKFGKAAMESEKILGQLHRDSGKNIRRKFTFPDEVVTTRTTYTSRLATSANGGTGYPYLYYSTGGAGLTRVTEVTTKTWFSGCFTYYLSLGNTLQDRISRNAAEARKLFGTELTPETVWNLAPWSWAVDWEGNIGDVLHNVSRFSQDGLVMRYGYIMQEKTAKISYTLDDAGRHKGAPRTDLHLEITSQSKIRRRATPFGFGFDMTALTGRQSAILGALGISRGPRHL
jgi:hypothetical protein